MDSYGVLIVDDSAFMRKSVSLMIENHPKFHLVGFARNGLEAIKKNIELCPDVLIMDVEMPEMDGIEAVRTIMSSSPVPIMMLSSKTSENADETIDALKAGAVDFFSKDSLSSEENERQFLYQLSIVAKTSVKKKMSVSSAVKNSCKKSISFVLIGCSTGGPSALNHIIPRFKEDFPVPVVVVQHMPVGFTKSLAEKFDQSSLLRVKEAERGDELLAGSIYIAPAGYQTTIQEVGGKHYLNISKDYSDTLYKPSVDVTILSASKIFKDKMCVAILTGMGEDGKTGCKQVREDGGYVIAESEETCVVYGMPKAVVDANLANEVVPIQLVYDQILNLF